MTDYNNLGGIGFGNGSRFTYSDASSSSETLNKVTGNHAPKFGGEARVCATITTRPRRRSEPSLSTRASRSATRWRLTPLGQRLSVYCACYPATASVPINPSFAYQHAYYGFFFQDDWRCRRLTLNLGLVLGL